MNRFFFTNKVKFVFVQVVVCVIHLLGDEFPF